MVQVKIGDHVEVHCVGWLENKKRFLSTKKEGPLSFVVGQESVLPGIDQAVVGMHMGEVKMCQIPPELGFGKRDEKLVFRVESALFPKVPSVGDDIEVTLPNFSTGIVHVVEVGAKHLTVDANHPYSDQQLTLKLKVVKVVPQEL